MRFFMTLVREQVLLLVEAACQDGSIRVYAIEKNPEGIELIRKNVQKLRTDNVQIVEGTAPEALRKLEPPTHVFIGEAAEI